jgi:hypothetical protein
MCSVGRISSAFFTSLSTTANEFGSELSHNFAFAALSPINTAMYSLFNLAAISQTEIATCISYDVPFHQ